MEQHGKSRPPRPIIHSSAEFADEQGGSLDAVYPNVVREGQIRAGRVQAIACTHPPPRNVPIERGKRRLRPVSKQAQEMFPKGHL